jgi:hypothetical protein
MNKHLTGRYDDISIDEYHSSILGWSKSSLDLVNKSMAHYLARAERERTPAMAFGSAVHCAVLEPHRFNADYVVAPDLDRRTKAGKSEYEDFVASSAGKTIISTDDMHDVIMIQDAIRSHPVAAPLLTNGNAEVTFLWEDDTTGLKCKCRPDYLRRDGVVVDIKTCESAASGDFQRTSFSYRYHVQGAFYLDGINAVLGTDYSDFVIIAIEKRQPYNVALYRLHDDLIAYGRGEYLRNLMAAAAYEDAPESERWAGYDVSISDLLLPRWAKIT